MAKALNSLERMLNVIDVVEAANGAAQFDELCAQLGFTRSTLYRYIKILSDSGFLTSLPELGYTLGPRIAELDYKMRMWDPLIIASRPVMAELASSLPAVVLLCRRYGNKKVLCVHQERGASDLQSNYERGRARPLLRGAASRIILANLPSQNLSRLYQPSAFKEAGLGGSLAEVAAFLKGIRQKGWDCTHGHLTPGATGIAAPLFDDRGTVLGSLSVTLDRAKMEQVEIQRIAERVIFCTGVITKAISQHLPR